MLAVACTASGPEVAERRTFRAEDIERLEGHEDRKVERIRKRNLECCERMRLGGEECELERLPPLYPKEALERGITGIVEVEYATAADGTVEWAEVTRSHPRGVFEQAALRSVYGWQFCPGEMPSRRSARIPFGARRSRR